MDIGFLSTSTITNVFHSLCKDFAHQKHILNGNSNKSSYKYIVNQQ